MKSSWDEGSCGTEALLLWGVVCWTATSSWFGEAGGEACLSISSRWGECQEEEAVNSQQQQQQQQCMTD